MRVFSNGGVVFVPRFGIEGAVKVADGGLGEGVGLEDVDHVPDEYVLRVREKGPLELFGKVKVRISDVLGEGLREEEVAHGGGMVVWPSTSKFPTPPKKRENDLKFFAFGT